MDRKAKRMEGDAKTSAHDEDTVFLDYLSDRTDGASFLSSWCAVVETRVVGRCRTHTLRAYHFPYRITGHRKRSILGRCAKSILMTAELFLSTDVLASDIRDVLPRAASGRVRPPKGRSPRDVWAGRRPHLRRSQNDGIPYVSHHLFTTHTHFTHADRNAMQYMPSSKRRSASSRPPRSSRAPRATTRSSSQTRTRATCTSRPRHK